MAQAEVAASPSRPVCAVPDRKPGDPPLSATDRSRLRTDRDRAGVILMRIEAHRTTVETALRLADRVPSDSALSTDELLEAASAWLSELMLLTVRLGQDPLLHPLRANVVATTRVAEALIRSLSVGMAQGCDRLQASA